MESLPLVLRHVTRVIFVTVGTHRHDSPDAAQLILVMDGDDALFVFAVLIHGSQARILLPGGEHAHMYHVYLHPSVRVKFFCVILDGPSPIEIAGGGNGGASLKRIEVCFL